MKRRVHAEVHPYSELNGGEQIKAACDPLILPSYRVNPQGEDGMSQQCDQCEVRDFKEHRSPATEGNVSI